MKEIFENIVEDDKRTASVLSSVRGMMKLEKREKERLNLNSLRVSTTTGALFDSIRFSSSLACMATLPLFNVTRPAPASGSAASRGTPRNAS
jgi:hypothetical protein